MMMEEVASDDTKVATEQMAQAKLEDQLHDAQTEVQGAHTSVLEVASSPAPVTSASKAPVTSASKAPVTSASKAPVTSSSPVLPQLSSPIQPPPPSSGFSPTPAAAISPYTQSYTPPAPGQPQMYSPAPTSYQYSGTSPQASAQTTAASFSPVPQAAGFSPVPQAAGFSPVPQAAGFSPVPQAAGFSPPPSQPPPGYQQTYTPPGAIQTPHEASAAISLPVDYNSPVTEQQSTGEGAGVFGWFSSSGFMNKVMEKTKSSVESMITTLDPGMKQVIHSGGDMSVVVTSTKDVKVEAVRQGFQEIFGKATVTGQDSQPNIAPQPVGYTAGLKGCEDRIDNLRRKGEVHEKQALVAVENFIVEMLPDRWYDVGCLVLRDPANNIEVQTFTQATPVPIEFVSQAQDQTPPDYNLRWSGLAVTVGQVIQQNMPYINHTDWHRHFTEVSRREMIYLAAKSLAGMYKLKLPHYSS